MINNLPTLPILFVVHPTEKGCNVRFPDSLYRSLLELAQQDGISLHQFIATAIAEKISALTTETYLEELAKQGDRQKYEAVLAKVPDIEPEPYDQY